VPKDFLDDRVGKDLISRQYYGNILTLNTLGLAGGIPEWLETKSFGRRLTRI